jgi:hypothetical protein
VSHLQSTLDTIDQALVDNDAALLPPLGYTCLRPGCTNGVITWLNRYYCSNKCRADVNDVRAQTPTPWTSFAVARQEDLPDPDAPVVLGMDPAGDAVVAVQRTRDGLTYTRLVYETAQLNEAMQRAAEGMRRFGESLRQATRHVAERMRQAFPDGMRPTWVMVDELAEQFLQETQESPAGQFRREWLNQVVAARPTSQDRHSLPEPMRHALEVRRNRNTGPRPAPRAPRRIDPPRGTW